MREYALTTFILNQPRNFVTFIVFAKKKRKWSYIKILVAESALK